MIAIVGDIHGRFKELYEKISMIENEIGQNIESIILLGDVMPIRNEKDLENSFVKEKYKNLELYSYREFYKRGFVPKKTYFIGGNHEPYCYLGEEKKELIENLVYLGRVGKFKLNNLEFTYLSGIYSPKHYNNIKNSKEDKRYKLKHYSTNEDCSSKNIIYFNKRHLSKLEQLLNHSDILLLHEHLQINPKENKRITPLDEIVEKKRPSHIFLGHLHMFKEYEYKGIKLTYLSKFPNKNSIYIIDKKGEKRYIF